MEAYRALTDHYLIARSRPTKKIHLGWISYIFFFLLYVSEKNIMKRVNTHMFSWIWKWIKKIQKGFLVTRILDLFRLWLVFFNICFLKRFSVFIVKSSDNLAHMDFYQFLVPWILFLEKQRVNILWLSSISPSQNLFDDEITHEHFNHLTWLIQRIMCRIQFIMMRLFSLRTNKIQFRHFIT